MDYFRQNIIPGEVIVQIFAFLTVFFLLRAMAWKKIQGNLEGRRERIRKALEDIEKSKLDLQALQADYALKLQKIEEEARAKIQAAVEEGRKVAREIQDHARTEANLVFEKSKENLEIEMAKARLTLQRDVADLALRVAEKVVDEKMTDAVHQAKALALVEEMGRKL